MSVASGCGEQEVGVASGSGWNLWVWLVGVVVRRYIDFLILSVRSRGMKVGDPTRNKLHDKCILTVNYGDGRR